MKKLPKVWGELWYQHPSPGSWHDCDSGINCHLCKRWAKAWHTFLGKRGATYVCNSCMRKRGWIW